ncbi:MAG: hypothetical protein H6721_02915 [Sandaracinus sp.]|nr:hypothetical protein [Sandaracinus sp.]MCB9631086.1 hypothetical protein [Sandaracinus sp.]
MKPTFAFVWFFGAVATPVFAWGCGDDDSPPPPPSDAGPRDAASDGGVPRDGGDDDDAAVVPVRCTVDPSGLVEVGRDGSGGAAAVASASNLETSALIFTDDLDGTVAVRLVTIANDGTVTRHTPEGIPAGATEPDVAAVGGAWWIVARESDGAVRLFRYDAEVAAVGTPVALASGASSPRIAAAGEGAFVAWREGASVRGRLVSATGTAGAVVELGTATGEFDLALHGEDAAVLLRAGTDESPTRVQGSRVGDGTPTSLLVGGSEESVGSVGLAGPTREAPDGVFPFYGAVAFDVRIGDSFRSIRLAVLDEAGTPAYGEWRVSGPGEYAWAASATDWGGGYLVAYRARVEDGGFSLIRVSLLDREACEVGRVDEQLTVASTTTEAGSETTVTSTGRGHFVVGWGETRSDLTEYRIAVGRCE